MVFTTLEHFGATEMSEKNATMYKALQETRRPALLKMAKKMKLKVPGHPATQVDLVEAIGRKKGLFDG